MLLPVTAAFLLSIPAALAGGMVVADPTLTINDVPFTTRAYWMRRANEALYTVTGSMCPFAAFGTVIVNHTASVEGELVCIGANSNGIVGNPTLHGESLSL